mmetsp:Transcript_16346/g.18880  ORF Transcript_16346/g.18880 Transcript_16346/m.18880 type:complete len:206 (-) Transcript_16346:312-929(-)
MPFANTEAEKVIQTEAKVFKSIIEQLKNAKELYQKQNELNESLGQVVVDSVDIRDEKARKQFDDMLEVYRKKSNKPKYKRKLSEIYMKKIIGFHFPTKRSAQLMRLVSQLKMPNYISITLLNAKLADQILFQQFLSTSVPNKIHIFEFSYSTRTESHEDKYLEIFSKILPQVVGTVTLVDCKLSCSLLGKFIALCPYVRNIKIKN